MGIILGALGGAGAAAQEAGATMMKSGLDLQNRLAVGQQDSDLALQRAEALKEFEITKGNQQREAQASRIDAAAQPILQQGIIAKAAAARANQLPDYDQNSDASAPGSFHGDAGQALAAINALPDGPDKQAALAQFKGNVAQNKARVGALSMDDLTDTEKTQFQPTASDMTHARTQAAIGTGDISPTEAAKLGQGAELAQSKLENQLDKVQMIGDYKQKIADAQNEVRNANGQRQYEAAMAKLQAIADKAARGDPVMTRMLITSENANIRSATSQLGMITKALTDGTIRPTLSDKSPNPEYKNILAERDRLRSDIESSKLTKASLFKSLGIIDDGPESEPTPVSARPPLESFFR